jgi:hypothetical protein
MTKEQRIAVIAAMNLMSAQIVRFEQRIKDAQYFNSAIDYSHEVKVLQENREALKSLLDTE